MNEADTGGDLRKLGRFVGRLLAEELVEIQVTGAPSAELFAITSRPREGFAISRHREIETAERACEAAGIVERAMIRIDDEHIVMLVAAGDTRSTCMLGYLSDGDSGIATSHLHVEGELVPARQQLVSSIVEGLASRRDIRVGQLGDFGDLDLVGDL